MAASGNDEGIVDITILGGGPVGLAAAYYGGHRDASVRIVEALEQMGGQVAALYPEKAIYDIAGYPKVGGQELVDRMVEQAMQFSPEVVLGDTIEKVTRREDDVLELTTAKGRTLLTRTLILTAGHGAFEPRKLGLAALDRFEGFAAGGVRYFVKEKAAYRGRRVAILGGGDSALDWTMNLQDTCELPIHLIHRRNEFRGLESSVSECRRLAEEGKVVIHTPCEVRDALGSDTLEGLELENTATKERSTIAVDTAILQLGFISHLGAIAEWGLEFENKKQVKVTPKMETNLAGVYAAGDLAGYDGKITLITIGFGEAAMAANHAVARIRGEKAQPKYSSE